MNIYVGNLPPDATEKQLSDMFMQFGEVKSIKIITDRETGVSRGFGFVEMSSADHGAESITGLNEKEFSGRQLVVNEARPRERGTFGDGVGARGGRGEYRNRR